jgi:hypothetical protein
MGVLGNLNVTFVQKNLKQHQSKELENIFWALQIT